MNNENEPEIDVPAEDENAGLKIDKNAQALTVVAKSAGEIIKQQLTSQEARVIEVNEALAPAYQKASTLELTDHEIAALTAPFPDSVVEIRPHDGLLYIPHIHISNRLNDVLKPGKWSLVCRRHWIENSVMYGEYVMVIKGCYVGESVGGHPYIAKNPKTNYSDSLESTAAEALRRIAGKRLSCGSQVWDPEYVRTWLNKYARQEFGKWTKSTNVPQNVPQTKVGPTPRAKVPTHKKPPSPEAYLSRMIEVIGEAKEKATQFCIDLGWIMPTEGLMDLPLRFVPADKKEMDSFMECLKTWEKTGKIGTPYMPHLDPETKVHKPVHPEETQEPPGGWQGATGGELEPPDGEDEEWRRFPMPFGKNAGVALEDLEKPYLFGIWANYTVETEYNGKPKRQETIAKDQKFREMLDMAGDHYQFQKND